jgi:hypothetical protein
MRYQFVDEIVSLALDGIPRIEVARCFDRDDDVFSGPPRRAFEPPAGDPARGARA